MSVGWSVNQDDRQTHSLALTRADDFAVCVSSDGKPCDIVVLCSSGRSGGSLLSETHSAWWVWILSSLSHQSIFLHWPFPCLLILCVSWTLVSFSHFVKYIWFDSHLLESSSQLSWAMKSSLLSSLLSHFLLLKFCLDALVHCLPFCPTFSSLFRLFFFFNVYLFNCFMYLLESLVQLSRLFFCFFVFSQFFSLHAMLLKHTFFVHLSLFSYHLWSLGVSWCMFHGVSHWLAPYLLWGYEVKGAAIKLSCNCQKAEDEFLPRFCFSWESSGKEKSLIESGQCKTRVQQRR